MQVYYVQDSGWWSGNENKCVFNLVCDVTGMSETENVFRASVLCYFCESIAEVRSDGSAPS